MSEMIDGFTAQKIKDFWLNNRPGCNTTHYACDCQIKRMAELETKQGNLKAELLLTKQTLKMSEDSNDELEARNKKYREQIEREIEMSDHGRSCLIFNNLKCDCHVSRLKIVLLGDGDNGI